MADIEKVKQGIKACWSEHWCHKCLDCPYKPDRDNDNTCVERLGADALELLKEPRKTKDEILFAIVSAIGYKSVNEFKKMAEEIGTLDEFMFGMYRAINAIEKLFAKDGENE